MFFDNQEETRVGIVTKAFNIWKDYEKKIEEMQYISDTLKEKYISVLKQTYSSDTLPIHIRSYINEKSKTMAKLVKYSLDSNFGTHKWDLKNIIHCWAYRDYAYQVSFTLNRKSYYIQIPDYLGITANIIEYVDNGMYSLWQKDSENCSTLIFKHYSKEKVAEFIKNLDKENKINEQEVTTRI